VGIPPRDATDHYRERMNSQLDIVFDVDPGELTRWAVMITAG
jgi:DNA primase